MKFTDSDLLYAIEFCNMCLPGADTRLIEAELVARGNPKPRYWECYPYREDPSQEELDCSDKRSMAVFAEFKIWGDETSEAGTWCAGGKDKENN